MKIVGASKQNELALPCSILVSMTMLLATVFLPAAQADEGNWLVAKGHEQGHELAIRYLGSMPVWVQKSGFPKLAVVSWRLSPSEEMPSKDELRKIYLVEDQLSDAVESNHLGVETAVVTGNGKVKWLFYAHDQKAFLSAVEAVEKDGAASISTSFSEDPTWSAYEEFHAIK